MKKNNLLPILLLAGAGVAAYMYFKNKDKAKNLAEGVDVEPQSAEKQSDDQATTTSEESEPGESKAATYIKAASDVFQKAKQVFKGRKKRKSRVIIEPTESSSSPFPDVPGSTRKQKRLVKRTARKTARTTKRTARTTRKQRRAVKGFDDQNILF